MSTRIRVVAAAVIAIVAAALVASAVVWRAIGPAGPGHPARPGPPTTAPSAAGGGQSAPRPPPLPAQPTPRVDCRALKCVALTFDDGPSRYTSRLLDILDSRRVKATFFEISGHALALPRIARRAYAEGFAIGDHTVTHPNLTEIPDARVVWQIQTAARQIGQVTGHRPTIMRPPFGAQDARVRALAGMPVIMWNVDPRDWKVRDTTLIERRVLDAVRPGAIVLMHDTHPATVAATPVIVDTLKSRGYTLVTVPQLLADAGLRPGVAYFHGG